ncbi:MAG: DUF2332 domain-containing protein [Deltaproteobacteria bacterium]|nr:MAG: DUF2332 domain-containing protein [Deltaproteobacteria bacterium]
MAEAWDRERTAAAFREFAAHESVQRSPLYVRLARAIADDVGLLALAGSCPPDQPPPNLLLAAVRDLLLGGAEHRLAGWLVGGDRTAAEGGDEDDELVDCFRDFCSAHRGAILHRLRTRRVQTNEIGRVALLLPGLHHVAASVGRPLATIELGASAGLNLLWPEVEVDYGDQRTGPPQPAVRLRCASRGGRLPLRRHPPADGLRLGIDSHPLDITDEPTRRWLEALIWPEDDDRRHRLRQAVQAARRHPVTVERADIRRGLQSLLDRVPSDQHPVFLHTAVIYQLSADERAALDDEFAALGRRRPVHRLSMEWVDSGQTELRLDHYTASGVDHRVLATVNAHGHWIDWCADPGLQRR